MKRTTINWRLREIAQPQRWNIQKLSEATGLAYSTVASIWHNQAKRADLSTIARLAQILNATPGDLLIMDDESHDE